MATQPLVKPAPPSWSKEFSAQQQAALTQALLLIPPDKRGAILAEVQKRQRKKLREAEEAKRRTVSKDTIMSYDATLPRKPVWKYGGEPVPFDVFCEQCLELRLFPKQREVFNDSGTLRASDLLNPQRAIQVLTVVFGKGSGKDIMIAAFIAWHGYVVMNLANPFQVYGAHKDTKLSIINVAPSAEVAKQVFFDYLLKNIKKPVFKPFLYDQRRQIQTDSIQFPHMGLAMYSKHSNPKTLEGFSPISFVIDEGDDFYDSNGRSTADDCFNILMTSSKTRYLSLALGFLISYPRTEGGFMMRKYAIAENDPTYYRILASTFAVRPDRSIDEPSIQSDYKNDPRGSRAKYECEPMPALDAFFEFPDRVMSCVDKTRLPCASVDMLEPRCEETKTGDIIEYVSFAVSNIVRKPGATYFMGIDGGEKDDSYAISVMHIEEAQDAAQYLCPTHAQNRDLLSAANYIPYEGGIDVATEDGGRRMLRCSVCLADVTSKGLQGWKVRDDKFTDHSPVILNGREWGIPHVYEDLLIEVVPERAVRVGEKDRTVDFLAVAKAAEDLCASLDIRVLGMDKWQTTQLRQGLVAATGVSVREMSFANADQYRRAKLVKMLVYQQRLTLLGSEDDRYDKRNNEWRRLQLINGQKIDHPEGGSKDLWDAESVAIYLAVLYKCADIDLGLM